jgi:hypothetical protein
VIFKPLIFKQCFYRRITTDATNGAGIDYHSGAHEFTPVFSGVRVIQSLVLCVMFCRSSFVLLSFFHWPFYCLPSFNLQFLIIPLVSSNLSYVVVLVDMDLSVCFEANGPCMLTSNVLRNARLPKPLCDLSTNLSFGGM